MLLHAGAMDLGPDSQRSFFTPSPARRHAHQALRGGVKTSVSLVVLESTELLSSSAAFTTDTQQESAGHGWELLRDRSCPVTMSSAHRLYVRADNEPFTLFAARALRHAQALGAERLSGVTYLAGVNATATAERTQLLRNYLSLLKPGSTLLVVAPPCLQREILLCLANLQAHNPGRVALRAVFQAPATASGSEGEPATDRANSSPTPARPHGVSGRRWKIDA